MSKQLKSAEKRVGQWLLDKWYLDKLLDTGGTAAVYEATHRNGNRVAIKILHDAFSSSSEVGERFIREGYVANRVQHDGAVTVLDDDRTEEGSAFIVMELLEGESLEQRLVRKARLDPVETLAIGARVLQVLDAAHNRGIIHRDIKPANIFLTHQGQVKVLDFGLARVREKHRGPDGRPSRLPRLAQTRDGIVIGTSSYMAPEQARGMSRLVDVRTDLWSLGATLFRALSGDVVHLAEDATSRLLKAMSQPSPSLKSRSPDLPDALVALVDRSLAFQRENRFQSAAEMLREVHIVYEELAGTALPADFKGSVPPPPAGPVEHEEEELELSVYYEGSEAGESIVIEYEENGEPKEILLASHTSGSELTGSGSELTELSIIAEESELSLATSDCEPTMLSETPDKTSKGK